MRALTPADSAAGLMFWSALADDAAAGARIERAGMDGSARSVVFGSGLGAVTALTLSADTSTIYWSDGQLGGYRYPC